MGVVFHPLFSPNISERYLKWRNSENLYKLYGYGLCKGVFPTPKNCHGMVLDRAAAPSDEVMVCKPSLEEPLQVLQVEVEKQGAFYVHCTIYKMSGAEVLNEELPADTAWWHLSRECYRKHGMANVTFQKMGKVVGRQFWDRPLMAYVEENIRFRIPPF